MKEAIIPDNEASRLAALNNLKLLDTPIEERFERITRLLCNSLAVPMAAFTLVDKERQWFKSTQGFDAIQTPRNLSFCAHAILEDDVMLVPDASKDERFFDNPAVTGDMAVSFYAGCPVLSPDGNVIGTLCAIDTKPRELETDEVQTIRDLVTLLETELKAMSLSRMQSELIDKLTESERMALVDPLTRLWNRTGIFAFLKRACAEAARKKTPIVIAMADIDHFKKINDTYGHPGGDQVLRTISRRLLAMLRTEDAIGRVGGEEFLIVLTGTTIDKVRQTVERICSSVAQETIGISGAKLAVTMSFGIAATTAKSLLTTDDLIKYADEALYTAKRAGRNRVEIANIG